MYSLSQLFNNVRSVPYSHTENSGSYYLQKENKTLFIYLQESNGDEDWKNNFDFPCVPYEDMSIKWKCHRGFLRVWKSIRDVIKNDIEDKDINRIIIVGYSHGAALAVLCYEYCVFHREDIKVYGVGFGCPRVLWGKVKKDIEKRFDNFLVVRNCRDLVTCVPPMIFGFKHIGKMLLLGRDKKYGLIKSHYPENYLAELERYEEANGLTPKQQVAVSDTPPTEEPKNENVFPIILK